MQVISAFRKVTAETWCFCVSQDALKSLLDGTKAFINHPDRESSVVNEEDAVTRHFVSQGFGASTLLFMYKD